MLGKNHRLLIKRALVFKRSLSSPLFFVKFDKNNLSYSRFGFIISKKIDKRATVRNRLRRLFWTGIQEDLENIGPGKDFLFIIKSAALQKTHQEIAGEIKKTMKRATL